MTNIELDMGCGISEPHYVANEFVLYFGGGEPRGVTSREKDRESLVDLVLAGCRCSAMSTQSVPTVVVIPIRKAIWVKDAPSL